MLPAARRHFPDELRGFALLGIILVNALFLWISTLGFTRDLATPWWDRVAEFTIVAFFQGKFYLLFAFLFGYSAHLILQAGNCTTHFARRLLGLALLGIAHALLFFVGDILLSYALLGIILLFAWRWPECKLLYGAACRQKEPAGQPQKHNRLWQLCRLYGTLVGLPLNLLSAWLIAGWLIAGPGATGGVGSDLPSLVGVVIGFCSAPFLSAAYVAWMLKIRAALPEAFHFFRSAGRKSMTVYISESIVLAAIFCVWGGGLFGKVGSAGVLAIALMVWIVLEVFAKLWLMRFSQGPQEFLMMRFSTPKIS